jgi:S-adenosylmethionine:tRNA ribosyltransferase-isomerase
MRVDQLSYDLPSERIAQFPSAEREKARLLVFAPSEAFEHRRIAELADVIPEGSLVVVNDTRVIPARLMAQKDSGGKVEIFLVRAMGSRTIEVEGGKREAHVWRALGKASKALRIGVDMRIVGPKALLVRLLERSDDGLLEVAFHQADTSASLGDAIRACGRMPLPPYIKRDALADDTDRYQTVFARADGAIAAPTAGLHFSPALLERLAARGVEVASVTLHVGLGTFQPVVVADLDDHPMHAEWYEVPAATAEAISSARARGARVVAVGTTVVRALESAARESGHVREASGETTLLIQPGYRFRAVDAMLTNFHLPRSTLLALVRAFGGTERVLEAYREAVREEYRFYSYGDAMYLSRSAAGP